ncbi:MAG: hypothetical protein ABFD20_02860, partial [Anaerolineales bacterium]
YAYLDGTSAAESRLDELLALLLAQGIGGLTVIPDRNWNVRDAAEKALKLANLRRAMDLAERLDLPVVAGTEMNKPGQRELDDFFCPELQPFWLTFQRGAAWLWGHTALARLGYGDQSAWARSWLPERRERNAFYLAVGRVLQPNDPRLERVQAALAAGPEAALAALR